MIELNDHLKLLYARAAQLFDRVTAQAVRHDVDLRGPGLAPERLDVVVRDAAAAVQDAKGLVGAIIGTPILLVAAFYHGNIPFFIGTIILLRSGRDTSTGTEKAKSKSSLMR